MLVAPLPVADRGNINPEAINDDVPAPMSIKIDRPPTRNREPPLMPTNPLLFARVITSNMGDVDRDIKATQRQRRSTPPTHITKDAQANNLRLEKNVHFELPQPADSGSRTTKSSRIFCPYLFPPSKMKNICRTVDECGGTLASIGKATTVNNVSRRRFKRRFWRVVFKWSWQRAVAFIPQYSLNIVSFFGGRMRLLLTLNIFLFSLIGPSLDNHARPLLLEILSSIFEQ